jgi:hypothetical protein
VAIRTRYARRQANAMSCRIKLVRGNVEPFGTLYRSANVIAFESVMPSRGVVQLGHFIKTVELDNRLAAIGIVIEYAAPVRILFRFPRRAVWQFHPAHFVKRSVDVSRDAQLRVGYRYGPTDGIYLHDIRNRRYA